MKAYALVLLLVPALWLGLTAQPAHAAETSHSFPSVASVAQHDATPAKASTTAQNAASCVVIVQRGMWLSRIAPSNWRAVAAFNHIANPSRIFPGEKIDVCVGSAASAPVMHTTFQPSPQNTITSQAVSYSSDVYGPCQGGNPWVTNPGSWVVPSGCYAGIFQGVTYNGANDCFALVQAITGGRVHSLARHSTPVIGAVMFFPSGNQGASSVGHWAYVVSEGHGMLLILEQNDQWRGGGAGRLDYRFVYSTGQFYY